jgi:hypothetical protein
VEHAVREKEHRAHTANRLRRSSSNNEAARLFQPINVRDPGSLRVGREGNQDKRRRQGSNNFVALTSGSGTNRRRFVSKGRRLL